VIAASGPSLDDGFGWLADHRDRFDLWALPSSFEPLVRRGLVPDAGVTTDPGFWAGEHLQCLAGTEVPVLAALGSAPEPGRRDRPTLLFAQGNPIEAALLEALGGPFPEVPSQGTVAVSALRLALEATTGPVFIAGLDLAFRDLRGHTSPHTADRRVEATQGRMAPAEGLWAQRLLDQGVQTHEGVRTSPALVTYAGWFRQRASFRRPVVRIAPSGLRWSSMVEASWAEAAALWAGASGRPVSWKDRPDWPDRARRKAAVVGALAALEARARAAAPGDPWVIEGARTVAPEALAADLRARRLGEPAGAVGPALADAVADLRAWAEALG